MKVITVTPAGRKHYLEILAEYLLRNRLYISEHHFWLNTAVKKDIAYIEMLAAKHPDFFKINRKKMLKKTVNSIWQYYRDYVDDDTIYIKFDDDICFFEKDAVKNLVEHRINNPKPLFVFGNIVNNAVCSYFFQKKRIIPLEWGKVGYNCLDELGWESSSFAGKLHKKFINDAKAKNLDKWKIDNIVMDDFKRFSIGVMCWFGRDLKNVPELNSFFDEKIDYRTGAWRFIHSDESFLSQDLPQKLNRPNEICGNALFSHFSFYIQKDYLELCTVLLDEYSAIALDENSFSGKVHRIILGKTRRLTGSIFINVKSLYSKLKRTVRMFLEKNHPDIYKFLRRLINERKFADW
jgi:hypothetical protein